MTYRREEVKRQYVKLLKRSKELCGGRCVALSITHLILILLFISLKIVIKKKWWREKERERDMKGFFFFFAEIKFIKINKTELHSTTRRDPLKSNISNRNWESLSN